MPDAFSPAETNAIWNALVPHDILLTIKRRHPRRFKRYWRAIQWYKVARRSYAFVFEGSGINFDAVMLEDYPDEMRAAMEGLVWLDEQLLLRGYEGIM